MESGVAGMPTAFVAEWGSGGPVIGILADGQPRAIPHNIMDWHEVLNDDFQSGPVVMSYCPLTGSALLWQASASAEDPTQRLFVEFA